MNGIFFFTALIDTKNCELIPLFCFQLQQYTINRNSSDFDDARMKELQKKGLMMYENAAITREYLSYKISILTRSIEELEQLEKYIKDEEKVICIK